MNVDMNVIEKEMEYIAIKIKTCKNVKELEELKHAALVLDMFYRIHTGKDYKEIDSLYIDEEEFEDYINKKEYDKEFSFMTHYENDFDSFKEVFGILKFDYAKEASEQYDYEDIEISYDEMKNIALDFYSRYGNDIYNIVKKAFDNKQIQIIKSEDIDKLNINDELKFYIDNYSEIDLNLFTDDTVEFFEKQLEESKKYFEETKELLYENTNNEINKLIDSYEKLKPKNKKYKKEEIVFEDDDEVYGSTYEILPLQKSYVLLCDEMPFDTLFSLIHELGHVIEDEFRIYKNKLNNNFDSLYLVEFLPAVFEYEFIKYLKEKDLYKNETNYIEEEYYMDLLSHLETVDKVGIEYDMLDEDEYINFQECIKYGMPFYMAILLTEKYKNDKEELIRQCNTLVQNRENYNILDLMNMCGISEEEFYNIESLFENVSMVLKK